MFAQAFKIENRWIGAGHPPLVVAELSGNHGGSLDGALALIDACKAAGAEAIKFQTYTADTITIDSDAPAFQVENKLWAGRNLYDLYREAETPFEWHDALFARARAQGLIAFSAPFDPSAVDLLEGLNAPAYKIASCEIGDYELLERVAATGKPVIISSGAASVEEIEEALGVLAGAGAGQVCLLHCISAYPTPLAEAQLSTLASYHQRFGVPVGFSDHTEGLVAPNAAAALGAVLIEKHVCMSRADGAVDSAFSVEPHELAQMIRGVADTYSVLGTPKQAPTGIEKETARFKRSLFVVRDIEAGQTLTPDDVRSIRPAGGLHPRHLTEVMGRIAGKTVAAGTPLAWDMLE